MYPATRDRRAVSQRNMTFQDIKFNAIDGVELHARLYSASQPGPGLVMCPGVSSTFHSEYSGVTSERKARVLYGPAEAVTRYFISCQKSIGGPLGHLYTILCYYGDESIHPHILHGIES
jgi:hypothetical protein